MFLQVKALWMIPTALNCSLDCFVYLLPSENTGIDHWIAFWLLVLISLTLWFCRHPVSLRCLIVTLIYCLIHPAMLQFTGADGKCSHNYTCKIELFYNSHDCYSWKLHLSESADRQFSLPFIPLLIVIDSLSTDQWTVNLNRLLSISYSRREAPENSHLLQS